MKVFYLPKILQLFLCFSIFLTACSKDDDASGENLCNDRILNQDEEDVDCGGVCPPCSTCDDGIQNQDELGVDCSGPCPACPYIPPCDYANNAAFQYHDFSNIVCDESARTIVGGGNSGGITIKFASFPTENVLVEIGNGNSIVIEDTQIPTTYTGVTGKLYVQFVSNKIRVTFCELGFTSAATGNFLGSGRVTCD